MFFRQRPLIQMVSERDGLKEMEGEGGHCSRPNLQVPRTSDYLPDMFS